jgi:hypothetical protein
MRLRKPAVREVVDSVDLALAKGHRLLRGIFPKKEMVSRLEWRHSLREREARLWTDLQWHLVIAESAGQVLGVATGTYLGNVNTGVIGYLAVSRSARGLGLGPKLRNKLRKLFQRDARRIRGLPLQAIVGEVRRNNPWLATLMRRESVLALDFPYLQPGLRRGEHPVTLVFYYESFDRVRRRLSTTTIRKLLYTIWRRIYRISRPLSDPAFRNMLRHLSTRRWIGPRRTPPQRNDLVGKAQQHHFP